MLTATFGYSANYIGRITPSGQVTVFPVPTANANPFGIAASPSGLWFCESSANKIGLITLQGVISEFNVPTAASQPFRIAAGPDMSVYFTELATNKVTRLTPQGLFTEFIFPIAAASPRYVTQAPDGSMWFGTATSYLGRIRKHSQSMITNFMCSCCSFGLTAASPNCTGWRDVSRVVMVNAGIERCPHLWIFPSDANGFKSNVDNAACEHLFDCDKPHCEQSTANYSLRVSSSCH